MTTQEIKALLERHLSLEGLKYGKSGEIEDLKKAEGFLNASLYAVELMLPLVEALKSIEEYWNGSELSSVDACENNIDVARQALNTLAQKLGG